MTTARTGARREVRRFRVVVGNSDHTYREQLVANLAELGNIEVAGSASTGVDTIIEAWRHRPDVVLLDLSLPGMSAAETTRHIRRAAPESAICLLVVSEGDAGISEALDAGARECLVKTSTPEEIAIVLNRL
ncbi:MAG: response regulator transcription factor [Chloroflexi bacterium]|nr:response regulator transcription factor [Chloroflexota bacterium]